MSKEKPEGEVVNFHTKIHLDLTEALAKRLGQKPTDEAVEEERRKNKLKKADEDWARDHPEEDEIEYPPKKKDLESEWHDSNIGKTNGK